MFSLTCEEKSDKIFVNYMTVKKEDIVAKQGKKDNVISFDKRMQFGKLYGQVKAKMVSNDLSTKTSVQTVNNSQDLKMGDI
jgi:hypothetical protein